MTTVTNAIAALDQSSSAATSSSTSSSTGSSTGSKSLGESDFLKLFMAQMQNQDPLNPMDATQFASQLAQYSSLEQLYNVNTNLQSIEGTQSSDSKYSALNLIGKEVQANSNSLHLENGTATTGSFQIATPAECVVSIEDQGGNTIREVDLGELTSGTHSFQWDGLDESGNAEPTGDYTYNVSAVSDTGDSVNVTQQISGVIDRVDISSDTPTVYVNDTPFSISDITDVSLDNSSSSSN